MAVVTEGGRPPQVAGRASTEWAQRYPPLLALVVALVIALAILPSALNLPQTNPAQTLEYAPVPPDDQTPPSDDGNLSSLGLGRSNYQTGGAAGGDGPGSFFEAPPNRDGTGGNPSTKRCVGHPPRQTEDPLAPPCVGYFKGDNFGSTYQGVTRDEVRLLVYVDGGITYVTASGGPDGAPANKYYDLSVPKGPNDNEHLIVTGMRVWQRYFNDRFQTYGRNVRFFVFFSGSTGSTEHRRADAADNQATVRPFAVLSAATEGNEAPYLEGMAKRGVLNFGSLSGMVQSFFKRYAKMVWAYLPSVEQQSDQYATYVCTKVVGKPAVLSGNADLNGTTRKLGMLHTTDPGWEGLVRMAKLVRQKVEACGGDIIKTAQYGSCCLAQDNSDSPGEAQVQMADFRRAGVTTILWTGGINGNYGKAAAGMGYYPEWIVSGDGTLDAHHPIRLSQNTGAFDKHAIVITPQTYQPALEQQQCLLTLREVDPQFERPDIYYLCEYYSSLFMVFTGIQVAGPRLGPTSVDRGFHAIPAIASNHPQVPACFYYQDDYTCVKDAHAAYWDASSTPPNENAPGCWRSIEAGFRYLPGRWPSGNIDAQIKGNEPCTGYNIPVRFNPV